MTRTALVTGGGSDIGRAIAARLRAACLRREAMQAAFEHLGGLWQAFVRLRRERPDARHPRRAVNTGMCMP